MCKLSSSSIWESFDFSIITAKWHVLLETINISYEQSIQEIPEQLNNSK